MTDETIQKDVSEGEQVVLETVATDPISKREARMAELHEARVAEQAEERKQYWLIENPEQTEEDYAALTAREEPAEREPEPPAPVTAEREPGNGWENVNGQRVKTLMVNGEKRQITEEQYDRLLQKDLAGDEKLRRAAQAERELQERQAQLEARERQLAERLAPKIDTGEILREKIKEHSELLLEGDVDAANEKMAEILTLGRESSTPNLDDLTTQVATRVTSEVERKAAQAALDGSIQAGWNHLLENFPDVVGDEDALAFADIQVKKVKAENPEWSPAQVIIKAGELTRQKLKLRGPATPGAGKATSADLTAQRMERKASIRPLPNATSKRYEKPAPVTVDMSPQAKIERMRASRVR